MLPLILLFLPVAWSGFETAKGLSLRDPPLSLHSLPCNPPRFSDHDICTSERFFIYDHFPQQLLDLWPRKDGELKKHYKLNHALGKQVNASLGMHDTHQFAAFTPIYHRLLHDYRSLPHSLTRLRAHSITCSLVCFAHMLKYFFNWRCITE
jgi:hypothetical protein